MALKSALGPELPYLRRYARAITGSQALGDAAIHEILEALLEAPHEFDKDAPTRRELYRVFHRLWRWQPLGMDETTPTAQLDRFARHALMLTAVEGFSINDAAIILNQAADRVAADVARARASITEQLVSDVMIIEDEAIIALHIKSIVSDLGHNVVGVARTHAEAVELARTTDPELVLADISLADGSSGIDAVREILEAIDVPVIFVTAFPERLLTGKALEPTYLVTKPFEPQVLIATIGQALMFHREGANARTLAA